MTIWMIALSAVVIACILSSKLLYRFGIPTLLIFLVLGMLCGSDGVLGFAFDDYEAAKNLCSIGLMLIMFYGGFGTKWKMARPVAVPALILSTAGVAVTAVLTALFCAAALRMPFREGMLVGSVVASTAAAAVFAILRSRSLNLKGGLASLLELESGSNDPFAYLLTLMSIQAMTSGGEPIWVLLVKQIAVSAVLGAAVAFASASFLRRVRFEIEGLYPIFVLAIAAFSYSFCEWLGGNGLLCVYLVGIVLGNSKILYKRSLVHFFDGMSWLMQILLFFTLGLLSFPSHFPAVLGKGVLLALFLMVVARPAAVFAILSWFRFSFRQMLLVSWVGLRGAASIAFAIYAVSYIAGLKNDIFHLVFIVSLLSVGIQGSLLPAVSKKLGLVDYEANVTKTFNDYVDDSGTKLLEIRVEEGHPWAGRSIMEANLPEEILVVMIRRGGRVLVPKGFTQILPGDIVVVSGNTLDSVMQYAT